MRVVLYNGCKMLVVYLSMKCCCFVVQFGSSKGLLAVNTIENVYILVEQQTSVHCSSGVCAIVVTFTITVVMLVVNNTVGEHRNSGRLSNSVGQVRVTLANADLFLKDFHIKTHQ